MAVNYFTIFGDNGEILRTGGTGKKPYDALVAQHGDRLIPKECDPDLHYVVDGEIVDRPQLSADAVFPEGTYVKVWKDQEGQIFETTLTEADEIFLDPVEKGRYTVLIQPPFPYLAFQYSYQKT